MEKAQNEKGFYFSSELYQGRKNTSTTRTWSTHYKWRRQRACTFWLWTPDFSQALNYPNSRSPNTLTSYL